MEMSRLTRDGTAKQTRLARPNSQARTDREIMLIFHVQLISCRIGNLTPLIHTVYSSYMMCDDTYNNAVAPVVQLVTSKPSDVGTRVRILVQSHERTGISPHK